MTATKSQVEVTCDNFFDLFIGDYAYSLVRDCERNAEGGWDISVDGGLVSQLVRWVLRRNDESNVEYTITRADAANILIDCANS